MKDAQVTPPLAGKVPSDPDRRKLVLWLLIPLLFFMVLQLFVFPSLELKHLSYSEFYEMVEKNQASGEIASAELVENTVRGKLRSGAYFQVNIPFSDPELIPLLRRNVPNFTVNVPKTFLANLSSATAATAAMMLTAT